MSETETDYLAGYRAALAAIMATIRKDPMADQQEYTKAIEAEQNQAVSRKYAQLEARLDCADREVARLARVATSMGRVAHRARQERDEARATIDALLPPEAVQASLTGRLVSRPLRPGDKQT